MRTAVVEKEWAEVRRRGRKVEDWTYNVSFFEDGELIDRHWLKTEADAKMYGILFEIGLYSLGEYGEVVPDKVFA